MGIPLPHRRESEQVIEIEVAIGEMVGSDQVLDRKITSEPLGGESDLPTRAKWRTFSRQQRSALKKRLTPPTLLERGFIDNSRA